MFGGIYSDHGPDHIAHQRERTDVPDGWTVRWMGAGVSGAPGGKPSEASGASPNGKLSRAGPDGKPSGVGPDGKPFKVSGAGVPLTAKHLNLIIVLSPWRCKNLPSCWDLTLQAKFFWLSLGPPSRSFAVILLWILLCLPLVPPVHFTIATRSPSQL
jgi:hypothetical protein